MKRIFLFFTLALLTFLLLSCKHATESGSESDITSTSFSLKYEKISVLPVYQQSEMLNCYSDKILVYGSYNIMLYDTTSKSWQSTSIRGDSIRGRWDGAIGKINNSIYAFGAPFHMELPVHYNVMKLDATTLALEELAEPLPIKSYDGYPAYETFDDKIMIVFSKLDSVYLFNSTTQKGTFVAKNILKITDSNIFGNVIYAFGSYENYLYIFNKYTAEFARINLHTYEWNKIEVPSEIKNSAGNYSNGGVFAGLLLLFKGGNAKALCYDIKNSVWGYGNCDIRSELVFETSYKNSSQFYFIDMPKDTLWRVTRVK
jgi:hypothetical protein